MESSKASPKGDALPSIENASPYSEAIKVEDTCGLTSSGPRAQTSQIALSCTRTARWRCSSCLIGFLAFAMPTALCTRMIRPSGKRASKVAVWNISQKMASSSSRLASYRRSSKHLPGRRWLPNIDIRLRNRGERVSDRAVGKVS